MADKPAAIDAEFRLVEDRWRPPVGRALFCLAYVAVCAVTASQAADRGLAVAMVCLAGMAWPLAGFIATIAEKVSYEQADLQRERITSAASPRRRQRRLSHQIR